MSLRPALLVAGKELRETLRDRRTIAVMVLFPLVVYPLVSLVTAQVLAARVARVDAHVARVAVEGPPALAGEVRRLLASPDLIVAPPAPAADLSTGRVDAIAEVTPGAPGHPPAVRILYDETREESSAARDRVQRALEARAGPACAAAFAVTTSGIAPQAQVSGYLLSKILPLVVVVMVMLGAFHPAIDITAGERERGTLETTLSAPIDRAALMAGKVLAVAALASLTGFLNLASMSLTVLEGTRLAGGAGAKLAIPWRQAAAAFAVVPPTAFLFAAVMVAIGALARSFKEAQTLLTPVYFLCMAPALTAGLGDFRLSGVTALIPGVGVTLLARDLVLARASAGLAIAVLASTALYGAAALLLASRLYDSERLFHTDEGRLGLGAWVRHVVMGRRAGPPSDRAAGHDDEPPTAGGAIALYGVACVLLFFVFVPLQSWRLEPGLALTEWVGLGGLTWMTARGRGQTVGGLIRLRRAPPAAFAGALLIGLSAWLVVGLVAEWVLPPPKEVVDHLRRAIAPASGQRSLWGALLLMAVSPAICEEALFRGPILRGLATRFSPAVAAILTGILFGIYHVDVWRLVPTAVLGIGLSAIALASDSILPSMLAHFTNNACIVLLARAHADDTQALPTGTKVSLLSVGLLVLACGIACLMRSGRRKRALL
ncbi:MAG TPA: ABC transporter permease subunit/CPBP intramembrane protease [Polyangia bacterium]|nr:ABC transporter permease subunit/CPBP intramembrane protease [Polyangia bacterium]